MENKKELTKEHKKQIKKLYRSHFLKLSLAAFKFFSFLFIANILVILLGTLYIHSKPFIFVGSFLNGFFLFSMFSKDLSKERTRVTEEFKKILENNRSNK